MAITVLRIESFEELDLLVDELHEVLLVLVLRYVPGAMGQ